MHRLSSRHYYAAIRDSCIQVEGALETEITSLVQMEKSIIERFKGKIERKHNKDEPEKLEGGICVICIGSTGN